MNSLTSALIYGAAFANQGPMADFPASDREQGQ